MGVKEWSAQNNVRLVNFPELDEVDDITAQNALSEYYWRISRATSGNFEFTVHAKRYNTTGGRKQHEVHARLIAPRERLSSTATEWNFLTALQGALSKMEKEAKKAHSTHKKR